MNYYGYSLVLMFLIIVFLFFKGDVWICMELMDTSLDKFYKKVIEKGKSIPEDILGKITVAVRPVPYILQCEKQDMEDVFVFMFFIR